MRASRHPRPCAAGRPRSRTLRGHAVVAGLLLCGGCTAAPAAVVAQPPATSPAPLSQAPRWVPDLVTDSSWSVRARRDTVVHLFLFEGGDVRPDSARVVIRDARSLALWWEYARGTMMPGRDSLDGPPPPPPTVDFRTGQVLAVTTSLRGGSGDWIRIDSVSQAGDTLLVHVNTLLERRGCGSSPAYARPVDLVLLPRVDGPIRFAEHRTPVGPCNDMDRALRAASGFDLTAWVLGPGRSIRRMPHRQ